MKYHLSSLGWSEDFLLGWLSCSPARRERVCVIALILVAWFRWPLLSLVSSSSSLFMLLLSVLSL